MTDRLALFPLGAVLFPGLLLPLHVFEERYRVLVQELLEQPADQRRFGVIAIRQGHEVGADGVTALHDIGCVAQVRRIDPYEDGRFGLVTTGAQRFRLTGLVDGGPYLTGAVELLPDQPAEGDETALLDRAVRAAFGHYIEALTRAQGEEIDQLELPTDPLVLSYAVAATVLVDLEDRQGLLASPDVTSRLRAELALLRRETTLLRTLTAAPSPDLTRGPVFPN